MAYLQQKTISIGIINEKRLHKTVLPKGSTYKMSPIMPILKHFKSKIVINP